MINPQNRLCKLVRKCETYEDFKRQAVYSSSWYLGPYARVGIAVTEVWLKYFWKTHKS